MNKQVKEKEILFAKVKEGAIIPSKEKHNAGYDIYPCFEEEYTIIPPHETKLIPTGITSALHEDYYFQIYERGSTGSKGIKYGAGVIDSSYRGEWFLAVTNTNIKPLIITKREAFKKVEDMYGNNLIIYPYEKALFQAVLHRVYNEHEIKEISFEELQSYESSRGDGCLGSSKK